jgi:hypothetical protein
MFTKCSCKAERPIQPKPPFNNLMTAPFTPSYAPPLIKPPTPRRCWVARAVLSIGWGLWWGSMFITAHASAFGRGAGTAAESMFWAILSALQPFAEPGNDRSSSDMVVHILCLFYCLTLLASWWPVVLRSSRPVLWFYRIASFAALVTWSDSFQRYGQATGYGDIIWAIGSTFIALSVWLVPPRQRARRP